MKTIHVDELQEKLEAGESLHVVDVREQDEYDAGHIPNVRFLPMSEIGERYTELQEGETYYLICKAGGRSENVGRFLEQYGYDIVNVEGGAIAHGHAIGATGAVLTTRLLHSMRRDGLKRGVVTLCIGGGQGIALALEAL